MFGAAALLLPLALHAQTPEGVDPSLVFYTHGDPSGEEQYLLELTNFARANPAAEGHMLASITDPEILRYYSHYGVDTNQVRSDFAGYQAKPPLAFNANLMASARRQSLDQAANGFQGHNGSDGSTFDGRITATGYQWRAVGENVYAYAENTFFGFVGMMADWGVPSQDHRKNLLSADPALPVFKETGMSIVPTTKAGYGPAVISQDFATPAADAAFLVGVVYTDTDANGFFTPGEGSAGTIVTSPQSSFYTLTTASGGYALPLDQINGGNSVQVTFDDGRGHHFLRQLPSGNNVTDNIKADLVTPAINTPISTLNAVRVKDANRSTLKPGKVRIVRDSSADLSQAVTVHYEVSGSAVAGQDYTPLQGWVSIPSGSSSTTIKVHPLPDRATGDRSDADQTVTITVESVDQDSLVAVGATQASLTIN